MPANNTTSISMEILTAMSEDYKLGLSKNIAILRSTFAIISVISSSFLIRAVSTSKQRLSTTYHRIVLSMAVSDILYSLPMTTFQAIIPSDMSYKVWNARGNQASCTSQGFFLYFGGYLTVCYCCSLNLYYLAKVKHNKSDTYIRKKIEPFLHGVPIMIALVWSITFLANDNYNNSGGGGCTSSPVYNPPHCIGHKDGEVREGFTIPCGRGRGGSKWAYLVNIVISGLIVPIITSVLLGILYRHVSNQERRMSRFGESTLNPSSQGESLRRTRRWSIRSSASKTRDKSNSRAVLHKAMSYTLAYFLAWGPTIAIIIMNFAGVKVPLAFPYMMAIFNPLQGFYDLLIFMYPKVIATKRSRGAEFSWCRAFANTFWSALGRW